MTTLPQTRARSVAEHAAWVAAQLVLLGLLGAAVGLGPAGWLAGTAFAAVTIVLFGRAARGRGTGLPGPADRVTLVRALLVGCVTAVVVDRAGAPDAVVTVLAAVALGLDYVDGRVARRTGTETALGARFDMEVDAFLILVLSVQVATDIGPWVLVIGLMRYVFVAASWGLRWLRAALPPSAARKGVAAAQGVVLVAVASGHTPFAELLTGCALAALTWSFGRDIAWLRRTRAAVPDVTLTEGCLHV